MGTNDGNHLKPLLLLNVDGVINDVGAVMKVRPLGDEAEQRVRDLGAHLIRSHGFWVAIPDIMPDLIRELTGLCETWWCSRWREQANDEIAAYLGVGPFPALECSENGDSDEAARTLIDSALEADRPVVWIQDFRGELPDIAGVTYVDTGDHGVLRWSDVPDELLQPAV